LGPSVPLYGDDGDNNGAVESAVATVAIIFQLTKSGIYLIFNLIWTYKFFLLICRII